MPQVVAYKSMKTMENSETVKQKSGCSRFQEVVVLKGYNCSDLAGKNFGVVDRWLLMEGGRTWKARGWTPHMKGLGMLVVSLRGVNFGF